MIVDSSEPVTLVGGADLGPNDLNIALSVAPRVVAADSGADHLLAGSITPDAIFGDFDSISPEARAAFSNRLHHIAEQDTTDLAKALRHVNAPFFVAVGFIGRRLDHTFAALQVAATMTDKNIVFLGSDDAVFVLRDGEVAFNVASDTGIAVLPLTPSKVSSNGLKWELKEADLSMDALISSSNQAAANEVHVKVHGTVAITLPRAQLRAAIDAVREV